MVWHVLIEFAPLKCVSPSLPISLSLSRSLPSLPPSSVKGLSMTHPRQSEGPLNYWTNGGDLINYLAVCRRAEQGSSVDTSHLDPRCHYHLYLCMGVITGHGQTEYKHTYAVYHTLCSKKLVSFWLLQKHVWAFKPEFTKEVQRAKLKYLTLRHPTVNSRHTLDSLPTN